MTRPFAGFEFLIAWRYLRGAAGGGWGLGHDLDHASGHHGRGLCPGRHPGRAAGFRAEFVDTILGANAHVSVYPVGEVDENGNLVRGFTDYAALTEKVRAVPGVTLCRAHGARSGHGLGP